MENPVERTIRQALRSKAPELYEDLARGGRLQGFLDEKVSAVSSLVEQRRLQGQWDYLPHLELVRNLDSARAEAVDAVLDELPQLHPAE